MFFSVWNAVANMGWKMVILQRVGYVNVVVNLVLQVLFLSQTLKNVFLGGSKNAASCKWAEKWRPWCGLEVVTITEGGER